MYKILEPQKKSYWHSYKNIFLLFLIANILLPIVGNKIIPTQFHPLLTQKHWGETIVFLISITSIVAMFTFRRERIIGLKTSIITLLILITYLISFRFNKDINFYLVYGTNVTLTDILAVPLVVILLKRIFQWITKGKRNNTKYNAGFIPDHPKGLQELSIRKQNIAKQIKERLFSTDNLKESFAIAIEGEWGQGKTTFLRGLYQEIKKEKGIIQVEFNPWLIEKDKSIVVEFLNELSNSLSEIHSDASHAMNSYITEMSQEYLKKKINLQTNILSNNNKSLQIRMVEINKIIEETDSKVVIYLDDLDRLEKLEIIEVLKLIRNSASFKNMFFLVAVDLDYINEAIKDLNISKTNYLEKIFQLRFTLRRTEQLPIQQEVVSRLQREYPEYSRSIEKFSNLLQIEDALLTHRDVIRFCNMFLIDFTKEIQKDVYFPDFFVLGLIKFRYPELYDKLFYETEAILTTDIDNKSHFGSISYEYKLKETPIDSGQLVKKVEPFNTKNKNELLVLKLQEFGISADDKQKITNLLESLFNKESGNDWHPHEHQYNNDFPNSNLRIKFEPYYRRYFEQSMQGNISQKEFDESLKEYFVGNSAKLSNIFSKYENEFSFKFEQININDFKSETDYKNHIELLLDLVQNHKYNRGIDKNLNRLLFDDNPRDKYQFQNIKKYFNKNKEEYFNYIFELISRKESINNPILQDLFNFHKDLNKYGLNEYASILILKLKSYLKDYSSRLIDNNEQFSWDFFNLYRRSFGTSDFELENHLKDLIFDDEIELFNKMKNAINERPDKFIVSKNGESSLFFKPCPDHYGFWYYKDLFNVYIKDEIELYKLIRKINPGYAQDLKEFNNRWNKREGNGCIHPFMFKNIPLINYYYKNRNIE